MMVVPVFGALGVVEVSSEVELSSFSSSVLSVTFCSLAFNKILSIFSSFFSEDLSLTERSSTSSESRSISFASVDKAGLLSDSSE